MSIENARLAHRHGAAWGVPGQHRRAEDYLPPRRLNWRAVVALVALVLLWLVALWVVL